MNSIDKLFIVLDKEIIIIRIAVNDKTPCYKWED
jgi:hypothetical protein